MLSIFTVKFFHKIEQYVFFSFSSQIPLFLGNIRERNVIKLMIVLSSH